MFQDVSIDFKYEFKTFLSDLMLADGNIDNNEFKIFDSITTILEFDEDSYLDNLFKDKKYQEIKLPSKYSVL